MAYSRYMLPTANNNFGTAVPTSNFGRPQTMTLPNPIPRQTAIPSQSVGAPTANRVPSASMPPKTTGDTTQWNGNDIVLPVTPTPVPAQLEVSPFLSTIYKSIQNIDPDQRVAYLQTTAASIKERLDRYEFRIARGMPLTPEQQRQYDSIKSAYNDIQKYINNPTVYDQLFAGFNANAQQAKLNRETEASQLAQRTQQGRMYGSA